MSITLNGTGLTVEKVVQVAREGAAVALAPEALKRIEKCRALLEDKILKKEIMYGVNTGIGERASVVLTQEQVEQYQRYLIYSPAPGYGQPTPGELVPMGEGEAFYKGERLPGAEALKRASIKPHVLHARDGLAMINGSNVIAGMSALTVHDVHRWLKMSEIAAAMTLEVLNANMKAYDERLHKTRGYPGALESAANVRQITEGSELLTRPGKKVQDAYSLRSTPQVVGAGREAPTRARD